MIKNIVKILLIVLIVFCGLFFFSLSNQIGGWRGFVVSSASMEPAIMTGSLVLTQTINPAMLKPDDVITFLSPTKERQFITHRISKIVQKNKPISFKTKGDNNHNEDTWIIAAGGVVGKVMLTVPYMGYFLSFIQSKTGIVLFILIPALWILYDEILQIFKLLSNRKSPGMVSSESQLMFMLFVLGVTSMSAGMPTQALLADQVQLTNNSVTIVALTPNPTLSPAPSSTLCENTSVAVSGNGVGSSNTVNVSDNCQMTSVSQTNNTTVINHIHTNSIVKN